MDLNQTRHQVQDNDGMGPPKRKRTYSPFSGSEGDARSPKKIKILQPAGLSPIQKSLSPADSVTSPTSHDRRTDESSESPSTSSPRRKLKGARRPTSHDLKNILQTNYKMLKEQLEPTELSEKMHEDGILDYSTVESIQNANNRKTRNDILIKAIYKQVNRKTIDLITFLLALDQSGQSAIAEKLRTIPSIVTILPEISTDERRDLLNFATRMEETLLEEVEPMRFIDDLVVSGGISLEDHEAISDLPKRRQRIQFLLDKIRSTVPTNVVRITKPMADAYSSIYKASKDIRQGHTTELKKMVARKEISDKVPLGLPLNIKMQITPTSTIPEQDQQEHDDPVTALRKKRQEAEDIEKYIVANFNENKNGNQELERLFETCVTEFKRMKFSCIKIYLKALSSGSLMNLVAYSRSGAAKKMFLSLIDEDTKRKLVNLKAKVVVEIYKGWDVDETAILTSECLCSLDKEVITCNFTSLEEMRGSRSLIKRLAETKILDDETKESLKAISKIDEIEERNQLLLKFLLKNDLPREVFCILEEEILKHGGGNIIRRILTAKSFVNTREKSKAVSIYDIKKNEALLREELEARWFIRRLESKRNRKAEELVDKILSSGSREERVDFLINYLLKETDFDWFLEELKRRNRHLLDTLLTETSSGKDDIFGNIEISRVSCALRFFVADIIEEVDPLVLSARMQEKAKGELQFLKLIDVQKRAKRALKFCLSLIGASQNTFCETLHAMKESGYNEIVSKIITLAKEGPLHNRYKCARIQLIENCNETCVLKGHFVLEETDIDSTDLPIVPTPADSLTFTKSNGSNIIEIIGDSDSGDECQSTSELLKIPTPANSKPFAKSNGIHVVEIIGDSDSDDECQNSTDLLTLPTPTDSLAFVKSKGSNVVEINDSSDSDDECQIVKTEKIKNYAENADEIDYIEILDNSPSPLKLKRKSRVRNLRVGSESGIFSGSGVCSIQGETNTDDDSDNECRNSDVDKRRMTKEWIENHSVSEAFSETTAAIATSVMDERQTNLEEREFLKQTKIDDFVAPLEMIKPKFPK